MTKKERHGLSWKGRVFGDNTRSVWSMFSRQKVEKPPADTADFNTKFDDILDGTEVELLHWPNYSNPYQNLFYGCTTPRFRHRPGRVEDALSLLDAKSGKTICFHVHWLNFLFRGSDSDFPAAAQAFIDNCRAFRERGGILIWTLHNILEHDSANAEVEKDLRNRLGDLAHIVIVHGECAFEAALTIGGITRDKILNTDHGSYIGVYEDRMRREKARQVLEIAAEEMAFLNLGFMRSYKGLHALIHNFDPDGDLGEKTKLILAGKVKAEELESLSGLVSENNCVSLHDGWVENNDIQLYMNASDFMVLPYSRILTSGSAILALSFGLPVIAPAMGSLPELIKHGSEGILYDPENPNGLRTALLHARNLARHERAQMRLNAFQKASLLLWAPGRAAFFRKINDVNLLT